MDKDEKELFASLNSKLSIIINLLMRKEDINVKDKVALLENVNISYKEASKILGISEKHYSKEKSLLKRRSTKNNDGKVEEVNNQEVKDDQPQVQQQS